MTAAYEPDLFPRGRCNAPTEHTLKLIVTFGASSIASAWGKDMQVGRNSAGNLTITLPRTYRKLTGFRPSWRKCQAGAVYFPVILSHSVAAAAVTGAGGTITLETRTEAGTATNPASGDELLLEFDVSLDALTDGYSATVV